MALTVGPLKALDVATKAFETELKIPVRNLETVRESLRSVQATTVQEAAREVNFLLDSEDRRVRDGNCVLRLREHGGRNLLTFKGPATFEGAVKRRLEYETEFDDLPRMLTIFEHLGFKVFLRYEKDREEWLLGEVSIALDHTPMGDFVELEGPAEELERSAERLGIDAGGAVRGSYISLWQEHREKHPELELPPDMVFDE